jgi:hypothetical protein
MAVKLQIVFLREDMVRIALQALLQHQQYGELSCFAAGEGGALVI